MKWNMRITGLLRATLLSIYLIVNTTKVNQRIYQCLKAASVCWNMSVSQKLVLAVPYVCKCALKRKTKEKDEEESPFLFFNLYLFLYFLFSEECEFPVIETDPQVLLLKTTTPVCVPTFTVYSVDKALLSPSESLMVSLNLLVVEWKSLSMTIWMHSGKSLLGPRLCDCCCLFMKLLLIFLPFPHIHVKCFWILNFWSVVLLFIDEMSIFFMLD